jgi:hypothetical protein
MEKLIILENNKIKNVETGDEYIQLKRYHINGQVHIFKYNSKSKKCYDTVYPNYAINNKKCTTGIITRIKMLKKDKEKIKLVSDFLDTILI